MRRQNSVNGDNGEEEFEFCFVKGEESDDVTAGDMFDNGKIRPLYYYPVFDTGLLLEAPAKEIAPAPARKRVTLGMLFSREKKSSEAEKLEVLGAESGSYCLWNPNERRKTETTSSRCCRMIKRSNSTGSVSKRGKLKDLLVHRSNRWETPGKWWR